MARRDGDDGVVHLAVDQGPQQRDPVAGKSGAAVGLEQVEPVGPLLRPDRRVLGYPVHLTGSAVEQGQVPVGVARDHADVDRGQHAVQQHGLRTGVAVRSRQLVEQRGALVALERQCQRHQAQDGDEGLRHQQAGQRVGHGEGAVTVQRRQDDEDPDQRHVRHGGEGAEAQGQPHAQRQQHRRQRRREVVREDPGVGGAEDDAGC